MVRVMVMVRVPVRVRERLPFRLGPQIRPYVNCDVTQIPYMGILPPFDMRPGHGVPCNRKAINQIDAT